MPMIIVRHRCGHRARHDLPRMPEDALIMVRLRMREVECPRCWASHEDPEFKTDADVDVEEGGEA